MHLKSYCLSIRIVKASNIIKYCDRMPQEILRLGPKIEDTCKELLSASF